MSFDFTKPNSTPQKTSPIVLTGNASLGGVGQLTATAVLFQAPQVTANLTGLQSNTSVGTMLALPNTVFLTGVQAVGHLSDDTTPASNPNAPTVITLSGIRVVSGTGSFGGVAPAVIPRTKPSSVLDIPTIIKSLVVPGGPCQGAIYSNGAKGAINWYNANVALTSICQFLSGSELDMYIRPYLDVYIERINADGSINDVTFSAGTSDLTSIGTVPQVYDDSYAATFIRLVCRYTLESQNFAWFDTNKGSLATILDSLIANNVRADGLVASYAFPRRNAVDQALLRNNTEDWAALTDYAALLNARNDVFNANRYTGVANGIAAAFNSTMWVLAGPNSPGYLSADTDPYPGLAFNPNVLSHAYPQALGVTGASSLYAPAYAYINKNAPGWENCTYDPSPWLVIGLTAALSGDTTRANTQTGKLESIYATSPNAVTVNELGMYQRIKSVLAGLPPA